jgi:hypothetical protein
MVGVQATRILPSDVRLSVRAFHENLWYNQNGRGLPNSRDEIDVLAVSQRENLRFKPFVEYTVARTDPWNQIWQSVNVGATGPITDQLDFYGSLGYLYGTGGSEPYTSTSNGYQSMLWNLRLNHAAGPNTTESLSFGRTTDTFDQQIATGLAYSITQVIGPSITGELIAMWAKVDALNANQNSFNDFLAGVQLTYFVSPRTEIRIAGTYQREYYPNLQIGNQNEYQNIWTGQAELSYHFTDTLIGNLLYQYTNQDTNLPENGYYENLVLVTISKFFP